MKKLLLIMAAALMTMTQCRKQETMPVTPAADTMKMTITAGPGRTDINTATGAITWSKGDKLYVSDGANWLGSLTLVGEGGSAQGTFTGSITGLDDEGTPCHFFYLGKGNVTTELTGNNAVSISFAAQDGTLRGENGAMKYHIGYGKTNVTVTEGEAAGYVVMNTKIAIAHINFTMNDAPHTGAVTMGMGGTGVSNVMTVNPDGTFSGSGDGGIVIGKGDGTTGEKYVTLIPTTGTGVLNVSFTGYATGSMTFAKGIHENKFYGMKDAIAVTLTPDPKFSVSSTTTVEFAPGNLYWDGTESKFHFEANQWDYSVGDWNESEFAYNWNSNHVSHFKWSDATNAVTGENHYSGELFCASDFTVTGDTHTDWRTLSNDEWNYLLGTGTSSRANASSLRAWKNLGDYVIGLVILPDGTNASVMGSITSTSDLAAHGAVFLPYVGLRNKDMVPYVGSDGYYWSSTPKDSDNAYYMHFDGDSYVNFNDGTRSSGRAVRLVRYR